MNPSPAKGKAVKSQKPPFGGFVIQTLLPPGVQQNSLHPFGGANTR
jgi:hypothetical protein